MTGQKTRIIRRFEREAKKQLKKSKLPSNFLDTMIFSLKDIKDIIKCEGYLCGHNRKPIILDDNELSITAFLEWNESVGREGDKSQCWECWCKEKSK